MASLVARRALRGLAARGSRLAAAGDSAPVVCLNGSRTFADATDASLKRTVLWDYHTKNKGKMVPFAGWSMPVLYDGESLIESVKNCRENCALFDVAHMLGVTFKGPDAVRAAEALMVADVKNMKNGTGSYSLITLPSGGIMDDTVMARVADDEIYLVLNAGCVDKDLAHIAETLGPLKLDVKITEHRDRALLALQGPNAAKILQPLTSLDLSTHYFGQFAVAPVGGAETFVTRTGYTGEDGFELSVPLADAVAVTEALVAGGAKLAGLGARDALRLEAGLPLYGSDLNEHITPVEAGLTWTIGKARREGPDAWNFPGGAKAKAQAGVKAGEPGAPAQRRVGLTVGKGAPPRAHATVIAAGEDPKTAAVRGEVTSGLFSPTLGSNIAMAYIDLPLAKIGTELQVVVRGKASTATVTKMPFVPTTYYRPE